MSDATRFDRRDFLKLVGLGVAGSAASCAGPPDKLIPYLVPPKDILPGIAYWYASTCRECPAACAVSIKTREGRAIKIEGREDGALSHGGLCPRGQASLQGLYDPDRVKSPMVKENGAWRAIAWDEALQLAGGKLAQARGRVAVVTDHQTGTLHALARDVAAAAGGTHLVYEPFSYESVREANRRTFGQAAIPNLDFGAARMIVSFGADFLETWLHPTGHARGFAAARSGTSPAHFVAVEPRLSLTGANADEWIAIRPGGEMALALGMVHVIVAHNLGANGGGAIAELVSAYTPEAVAQQTDVSAETIEHLARQFAGAGPSLAVAGGIATQSEQSVALVAAVNLLNHVAGNVGRTVRFDRTLDYDAVASFTDVQRLIARMEQSTVDVLVVLGANPAYALPAWTGIKAAMEKVPFKVSLSPVLDETAEACDLLLPSTHWIETLGDAEAVRGVHAIVQPAMQKLPMFDARPAGDTLLALAKGAALPGAWSESWSAHLKNRWRGLHARTGAGRDFDTWWSETLAKGGITEPVAATAVRWTGAPAFAPPALKGDGDVALVLYPSSALYDGRGANKGWLQEMPDVTTKAVWGSWAEIHPDTARALGVKSGDAIRVQTGAGSLSLPAYVYAGVRPDVVAIPLGQGHTAYGRYAKGRGVNALDLLPAAQDGLSGAIAYFSTRAALSKAPSAASLSVTQTEKNQHGRRIAQVIPLAAIAGVAAAAGHGAAHADTAAAHGANGHGAAAGGHHEPHPSMTRPGKYTEPLDRPDDWKMPAHAVTAYEPEHVARHPRQEPISEGSYKNAKHRWAMAIDLQRCTGCSACVVACYAENNIPTVGPAMVQRGRELAWIRIERFEEKIAAAEKAVDVRHVPMMCQHCGDAPCETVCPVYATYHNPEGLNAQVYNRCVGTRYCSNNCPYKVRAFNWFDYTAPEKATFAFPEPLNWQLNPDVTVRSKGVMEKCTMCIQRILEGKGHARDAGRELRDGDILTACQQGCPTEAIVFGDLMDPSSRVSQLSHGDRRYWVFNELNTKPGVTYLKKVQQGAS